MYSEVVEVRSCAMSQPPKIMRSLLRVVMVAVVLLAITFGLEYLSVTNRGYRFGVFFSLIFAFIWGSIRAVRELKR